MGKKYEVIPLKEVITTLMNIDSPVLIIVTRDGHENRHRVLYPNGYCEWNFYNSYNWSRDDLGFGQVLPDFIDEIFEESCFVDDTEYLAGVRSWELQRSKYYKLNPADDANRLLTIAAMIAYDNKEGLDISMIVPL